MTAHLNIKNNIFKMKLAGHDYGQRKHLCKKFTYFSVVIVWKSSFYLTFIDKLAAKLTTYPTQIAL